MMRKVVLVILSVATFCFAALTIHRSELDYNENGVYFDGEVTYSADAVLVFGTMTAFFLLLTLATFLFWRKKHG